jgi:hypothetical protein
MAERVDLVRVDTKGGVQPVGKAAVAGMRARAGEWRFVETPRDLLVLRRTYADASRDAVVKLAGEIRTPGAMCDIVALIGQAQWRGEMAIIDDGTVRSVYFEKGSVVGASSNVPEERLGEILYRAGVLTRDQIEAVVEASQAVSRRFGEAILELKYQTPEQLFPMMVRQVQEVFYSILQLSSGAFFFFDRFDEKLITYRYDLEVSALLMDGIRRMDEMRFFREKIPSDECVPIKVHGFGKPPPAELFAVYDQCDAKHSIAEIGRTTGMLEFEVTRDVFQLISGGFVSASLPRPHGVESIVATFNRALAMVHETCGRLDKVADLREALARFAGQSGIYEPLFHKAGPADDGTLRPDKVSRNLATLAGDDPETWLTQLLHEYIGFAMFKAEALLPREIEHELKVSVAELLKPVRPIEAPSRRTVPPGSSKVASTALGPGAK